MSENDIPDPTPIKVWVTEHDDEDVRWVINTREDMEQNLSDRFAEVNPGGIIKIVLPSDTETPVFFDAADLFKSADPIGYEEEFIRYCQGWDVLEMPFSVFFAEDDSVTRDWVTERLT